jgi:hypothetical protein
MPPVNDTRLILMRQEACVAASDIRVAVAAAQGLSRKRSSVKASAILVQVDRM